MASEDQTQIETAWLEAVLNKQLYDNSISKIVEVNVASGVPKGQNYASEIFRVKIELILGSGRKTRKSFILKKLPQGDGSLKVIEEFSVFKKETKMYCEILPHFEAIMNEFEDSSDKLWCTYVGHKPYTEILLEDLKLKGFKVANRKECLSVKHGLLVMNCLGRFHAMSHVLFKMGTLDVNNLSKHFLENDSIASKRIAHGGFKALAEVMEHYWPPECNQFCDKFYNSTGENIPLSVNNLVTTLLLRKRIAPRIAKLADVVRDKLLETISRKPEDAFLVLNHGDCWTCNMMFKYCPYEENTPIAVKFLDFQACFYNTYIIDIINFLYTSITGGDRRQNMDLFLHEYHRSLVTTLKFYGVSDMAPSIDHVYAELKRAKYLTIFHGLVFYPCSISESNEPFDLNKLGSDCDSKEIYNLEIFKSEKYRLSVEPDIRQWIEEGLF